MIVTVPGDTGQGEFTSIALDQDGNPHISFMDETDVAVKYVRWDGSSWAEHQVDTLGVYAYPSTSLALDGNSHPQIAYPWNNPVRLGYAESDGQQWSQTHIDVGGISGPLYADLALKADDEPCISYYGVWMNGHALQRRIRLLCRTAGSWQSHASTIVTGIVYTQDLFDIFRFHSLALDSQNRPHISFTRYSHTTGAHELRYASPDASQWGDTVDDAPDVGFFSSLALDSQERPHISYYDLTNADLKYARRNGDQWIIQTVDSDGDVGRHTSLALDGSDHPHISYDEATNGSLEYASWDGSQWQTETVDSSGRVGGWTSLALNPAGNAHISYYDITNARLKYATNRTQDEYTLEIDIVGEGRVHVDPHQDTYRYGDVVTLTAAAESGWFFAEWTGDVDSIENPLLLTIQRDTELTATFCYWADVNCDGKVDIEDIQAVAGAWRCAEGDDCYDPRYDVDGDGIITVVDIMLVAREWGWPAAP